MPVIRNGNRDSQRSASLVAELLSELRDDDAGDHGPHVYENTVGQTGTAHITVIWDAWADLPLQARSRIILDAYDQLDAARSRRITIALGLTPAEAATMGLLPYSVTALLTSGEDEMRESIRAAIRKLGGFDSPAGLQLRFRTLSEAESARRQLEKEVPGAPWTIIQEAAQNSP